MDHLWNQRKVARLKCPLHQSADKKTLTKLIASARVSSPQFRTKRILQATARMTKAPQKDAKA